ncbi:methyl-accepting chemotaxis protein, partial [Rhizobium ruizarguesonis]
RHILQRLAEEASTLGIDLFDIAGAIQDMAGMSARHASAFDHVTHAGGTVARIAADGRQPVDLQAQLVERLLDGTGRLR